MPQRQPGGKNPAKAKKIEKHSSAVRHDTTRLSDQDLYLFNEGSHLRLYDKLGSHPLTVNGVAGTYFAVWAPNAEQIFVAGDFNCWNRVSHPLCPRERSGI
jgi:1,4-alpha-glucan branching enzyme